MGMIVVAIAVLGMLAVTKIPVSLLPDVDVPGITVQISCRGASAKQIDRDAMRLLRSRLSQVTGLKDIQTEARMDAGMIKLAFVPGSNIDLILIEVNEKIDMAMGALPKDFERPKVMKSSVLDIPAFFLEITLKDGATDMRRFMELSDFAANVVRKRIEQLPQVAMVDISGTVGREIVIIPDYDKMHSMGITTDNIEKVLSDNNITVGALSVIDGRYRYNIHFDSQLLVRDDIAGICITHEGRLMKLSDICRIEQKDGVRNGWVRHNGNNAITMAVIKHSDARMSELKEAVDATVDDLKKNYPDTEFSITRDQTRLLSYSFSNLESNLLVACILTCIVLFVFLRNGRLSLIVALTIPLSLIITLLMFYVMGVSLNVISISGLILGVGMIVDNAIIVTDNIIQKLQRGNGLEDAVCHGAGEVFTPMLCSVLTTCSVFVPLIFISGIAGELFFDMSVGISVSLFASLAVAVIVVPVTFYGLFRVRHRRWRMSCVESNLMDRIMWMWYEKAFFFVMRHTRLFLVFFALSIPGSVLFYMLIDKQRMPELSYTDTQVVVIWNEGISEQESDKRISELMAAVKEYSETSSTMTGTQSFVLSHTRNITGAEALGYMYCGSVDKLAAAKRRIVSYCDSAFGRATVAFEPVGNPFDMILNTSEHDLELRMRSDDGGRPEVSCAVAFTDSLQQRFPGIHIPKPELDNNILCRADVVRMAFYGVSYRSLFSHLQELTGVNRRMEISYGEKSMPVIIGVGKADRSRIMQSVVRSAKGVDVPVSYLVTDSVVKDYKRLYASSSGEYYPVCMNGSHADIERVMKYTDSLQHAGIALRADYGGGYFTGRELIGELSVVLAVALALLFFILAAQFESLVQPLIILSEMVVNCFFVLALLWCFGISLNLMSMIGIVVMSGIVINDSILKIDTVNRHVGEGMGVLRAVVAAGKERLRPIVMTSATTVFGVMPFLSRGDMGSDLQYPLSFTIIIGMIVGTMVSLFFVPMLYYVIYGRHGIKSESRGDMESWQYETK